MSVLQRNNVTSSSEIRKIPIGILTRLSSMMETNNAWKMLMGIIPDAEGSLKYTSEHVKLIEEEAKQSGRAKFSILVDEWGSSGKNRPKIYDLINLLHQVELFQAADYLCECVGIDCLPRPNEGPAASISYGEVTLLQTTDDLSNQTIILNEARNEELNQNYCNNTTLPETLPTLGQFNTNLPHLDYSLLECITNNFNSDPIACQGRLLGSGGFGAVFLGMLPPSFSNPNSPNLNKFAVQQIFDKLKIPLLSKLAVKKLKSQQLDFSDIDMKHLLFRREVETMSGYVHENLLTLLAYSANGPDCCLVYPYMPNGSLEARLACEGGSYPIQWNVRLNAANGVAAALIYLHGMEVVHRDVKSANVLLDNDMRPKLGDFGLIRICTSGKSGTERMTSTILGTPAFMAPEAFRGDMWTGLDTFSFGVVLLELLVGLPSIDEARDDPILIYHIETALEEKEFIELLDPRIPPLPETMANRLHSIANSCLQEKKKRPSMVEVYTDLLQVDLIQS